MHYFCGALTTRQDLFWHRHRHRGGMVIDATTALCLYPTAHNCLLSLIRLKTLTQVYYDGIFLHRLHMTEDFLHVPYRLLLCADFLIKGLTLVQALGSRGDRSLLIGWFLLRLSDFSLVGNITDHGRILYQTKRWNSCLPLNYDLVLIILN